MTSLSKNLLKKLPSMPETLRVFSVIVVIVFSWSIYRMVWYVPSWLKYLSIWSVLITAGYVLSFALFESLVFLGLLLFLSLVFPGRFFRNLFVAQGSFVTIILSLGAFLFQRNVKLLEKLTFLDLLIYPVAILFALVVLIIIFTLLCERYKLITRFINTVTDRMTVFLYLYIPLGLLGFLVVLLRNLL